MKILERFEDENIEYLLRQDFIYVVASWKVKRILKECNPRVWPEIASNDKSPYIYYKIKNTI